MSTPRSGLHQLCTRRANPGDESVHEIEGDVAVEPNHVYVILQNTSLTITDGTLRLAEPAQLAGHRAPIDGFFMSLAEDQGENAACVILSGGGYDGTQGLCAIKEQASAT